MKKNKLIIALASLAVGLVLAGCSEMDEESGNPSDAANASLPVGCSYEAQWQVDREVIDTATLSVPVGGSILVSRVPTDWLLANFMPVNDHNGILQSSEPLQLNIQVVGFSGTNSYFSAASAAGGHAETSQDAITLADVRQLFSIESNAIDDSCSVTAYWSPMHSAGVYDSQRDAWTIVFAVDSVVVERVVAAEGGPSASSGRQQYRSVELFSPAVRLNLVTTKRKE